jgi:Domain of unknown function (DUF1707)
MSTATGKSMRASDGDRERVVEFLKEQTAQGRLTLEELEERTGAAYAARTRPQLQRLTEDLPGAIVDNRDQHEPAARIQPTTVEASSWQLVLACCCWLPRRPSTLSRPEQQERSDRFAQQQRSHRPHQGLDA